MSVDMPPSQFSQTPQTPPRTPRRAHTVPNQSLSPLPASVGPFSNLPSFIYSGPNGDIEFYDDEIEPHFEEDLVPPPLPIRMPLQLTDRAMVGLRQSNVNDSPDFPMDFSEASSASSQPPSRTNTTKTKAKGISTPRRGSRRFPRASLPSTPTGSLRLPGFQSMASPILSRPNESKIEIMMNISCMPNRNCSPEEYRVEAYEIAKLSKKLRPLDVTEGNPASPPLYEPTVVDGRFLGLLDIDPVKEVTMSDTPALCGEFTFNIAQKP